MTKIPHRVLALAAGTATAAALTLTVTLSGGNAGASAVSNSMPRGDLPGFRQVYADNFNGTPVPVGAFSDCNHRTDTPQATCEGLRKFPAAYANYWAYPKGWDDTAKSGADGNDGAPFGGGYRPELTVSIGPASATSTDGVLHVRQFRPASGGDNAVAAVVPRKCMGQQYGKYSERFRVVRADPGFKSAHLFYDGGEEIDYPEGDWPGRFSGFVHPNQTFVDARGQFSEWNTTSIEWVPGKISFFLNGKLIKTVTKNITKPRAWIWQNESSIEGPYAKPGASAEIQTTWATCYARTTS